MRPKVPPSRRPGYTSGYVTAKRKAAEAKCRLAPDPVPLEHVRDPREFSRRRKIRATSILATLLSY